MKNKLLYIIILVLSSINLKAQYNNQSWLIGLGIGGTAKNNYINFGSPLTNTLVTTNLIPFSSVSASIGNNSQVSAITNGIKIFNSQRQVMTNGDSINPCSFTSQYPMGLPLTQSHLLLPKPGSPDKFILVHESLDLDLTNVFPYNLPYPGNLLLSEINMLLDNGQGAVTQKNQVILTDTLIFGKVAAVKHANGRDWWVLSHSAFGNEFYKLLITPDTVMVYSQNTTTIFGSEYEAMACFSPDGSKYAVYYQQNSIAVYEFDRCSGILYNPNLLSIDLGISDGLGCTFSPNNRFLYVNSQINVYQFDTWASNLQLSQLLVGTYDGFLGPQQTRFFSSCLAYDQKIYLSTGNSTNYLHVIENPDSLGLACNLNQHSILLTTLNGPAIPNLMNNTLGPLTGSGCDTLTGITALQQPINEIVIAPNPTTGVIRISSANLKNTVCNVYNSMGEFILEFNITDDNNPQLDLSAFKNGLYFIKVITAQGELISAQKIVLAK